MVGRGLRVTGKAPLSPPTGTPASGRAWRPVDLLSESLPSCFSKTSVELDFGDSSNMNLPVERAKSSLKHRILGPTQVRGGLR